MKGLRINKLSLKEQVQEILYEKIIAGELEPGERLKVIPIAKALNVSQAPVREAIQCLVSSGHLEQIPNVGARVKLFTEREVRDIYELRRLIEIGAIQSDRFQSDKAAELMSAYLQKMSEATANNSYAHFIRYDTDFHRTLVECCGNQRMLSAWDSLLVPRHVKAKIKSRNATLDDVLPLHQPLVDTLKANKKDEAISALEHHYNYLGL